MPFTELDRQHLQAALELAERGRGYVEPNPLVGCLIAHGPHVVGRGWHARFGGPHAEVVALQVAGESARGATLYVTLEPCCHTGKTPPCTQAVIRAGLGRVVIAHEDPFPLVAGTGVRELRQAGIAVDLGLLRHEAERLNAAYRKRLRAGRPWVIAKWAMTLDGRIATQTGHSRWISSRASRQVVHSLRGRVDAILVGSGTAMADDPALTVRPRGPRIPCRIVIDSLAVLPLTSRLVKSLPEAPLLVAVGEQADARRCDALRQLGAEVLVCAGPSHQQRLSALLDELGRRSVTNLLVEGGGRTFGNFWQLGEMNEVHAFVAAKLIAGVPPQIPNLAAGCMTMDMARPLDHPQWRVCGDDLYVHGHVDWSTK